MSERFALGVCLYGKTKPMKNMKRPFILILIALLPMVSTVSTAQSKSFDKYEIRAGTDVYKWLLATNETSYRDLGWAVDAAYHWGLESTYDLALSFSLQGGRRRHHSAYNLDFINPSLIMSAYRNIPLGTKSKIYAGIGAGTSMLFERELFADDFKSATGVILSPQAGLQIGRHLRVGVDLRYIHNFGIKGFEERSQRGGFFDHEFSSKGIRLGWVF